VGALRKDVAGRVSLEIHQRFLDEYLTPGARVLEVGAGPGTFTQHLAAGGARLTVTDLSPVQLAEDAPAALRELLRVTGAGGTVLASVMSTLGSCRHLMPDVVNLIAEYGDDVNDAVLRTGDLRLVQPAGHVCVMYRAEQIPALVARSGGTLAGMSASNWSSLADPQALARLEADPAHWSRFLDNEAWACRQPGCLNGGTHLIFAARYQRGPAGT
jgi:SAM-dependent methyltransferase